MRSREWRHGWCYADQGSDEVGPGSRPGPGRAVAGCGSAGMPDYGFWKIQV